MKILILGGNGVIGTRLVDVLKDKHKITVVDNLSGLQKKKPPNDGIRFINKDVCKMKAEEFKGYNIVICMAARIGGIEHLNSIPYDIAKDNTEILQHSIDMTLKVSPKEIFYYFSSSLVFERSTDRILESNLYENKIPKIAYALQKLFGEMLVESAHKQYGLQYVIVRPFNVVGDEKPVIKNGKLGNSHVIPDLIYKAMKKQRPFEILGTGNQIRSFTHVDDFVDAINLMISRKIRNTDLNICNDENVISIENLAHKIWVMVNPNLSFPKLKHLPAPTNDVMLRLADTTKARKILGWKPRRTIEDIIEDAYENMKVEL